MRYKDTCTRLSLLDRETKYTTSANEAFTVRPSGNLFCELIRFCDDFVDVADHVESHLRKVVVLASKQALET